MGKHLDKQQHTQWGFLLGLGLGLGSRVTGEVRMATGAKNGSHSCRCTLPHEWRSFCGAKALQAAGKTDSTKVALSGVQRPSAEASPIH